MRLTVFTLSENVLQRLDEISGFEIKDNRSLEDAILLLINAYRMAYSLEHGNQSTINFFLHEVDCDAN